MSIPNYPECNSTVNGEEYYTDFGIFGAALSIPFLLSSAFCTCIISLIFAYAGYNTYNTTKQYSAGVILFILIAICCLSSFIGNLVNLYKAKTKVEEPENKGKRPCISKNGNLIVNNY